MDSDVWSSDTNSLDHHAPYTKQASTSDSKPFRDGPRYSADSVDRTGSKTSALVSVSRILLRGLSIEVLSVPMPDGDLSSEGRNLNLDIKGCELWSRSLSNDIPHLAEDADTSEAYGTVRGLCLRVSA